MSRLHRARRAARYAAFLGGVVIPPLLAPVLMALPAITGIAQEGQTLSVSDGVWTNSPSSFIYQWRRNGAAISGSTFATRLLTAVDVGAVLTVTVTAANGGGSASATSAGTAAVIAASVPVPANTGAPAVTGTGTIGQTLTTTNGSWSGNPTSYAYQWRRDGVNIPDATGSMYILAAADDGASITCRVTATNAGGSAGATSNAIAVTAPAVSISSIDASGWTAQWASGTPPTFAPETSPQTLAVSYPGFDASGAATTITDDVTITRRLRQPYPDQASFTPSTVVLSEYVPNGATIVGVTNNAPSTMGYPKAIARWSHPPKEALTGNLVLGVVAFQKFGRGGLPVRAVKITGTPTTGAPVTKLASYAKSARYGDNLPVWQATFNPSDFPGNDGGDVRWDFEAIPWIGTASEKRSTVGVAFPSISTVGPLVSRQNPGAQTYAFVSTTGDNSTAVTSTTRATAKAKPYTPVCDDAVSIDGARGLHIRGLHNSWEYPGSGSTEAAAISLRSTTSYPAACSVVLEGMVVGVGAWKPAADPAQWMGGVTAPVGVDFIGIRRCSFMGVENAMSLRARKVRLSCIDVRRTKQDAMNFYAHTLGQAYYQYVWADRITVRDTPGLFSMRGNHNDVGQFGSGNENHLGARMWFEWIISQQNAPYAAIPGSGGGTQGFEIGDYSYADNLLLFRNVMLMNSSPTGIRVHSPQATMRSFIDRATIGRTGRVPSGLSPDTGNPEDFSPGLSSTDGSMPLAGPGLLCSNSIVGDLPIGGNITLENVQRLSFKANPGALLRPEDVFAGRDFTRGGPAANGMAGKFGYDLPNEQGTQRLFIEDMWANFRPLDPYSDKGCGDPTGLVWDAPVAAI